MNNSWDLFWTILGLPLSRFTGAVADFLPFSVSELLLQWGLISIFLLPIFWWRGQKKLGFFALLGVGVLIVMAFSQGATPIDWVPSALRTPIAKRIPTPPLSDEEKLDFWNSQQQKLLNNSSMLSLPSNEKEMLGILDQDLERAFKFLGIPRGRKLKNVKELWGLSRLLGLAYGGPAYHDVITGEVVLVSEKDLPTASYWRIKATLHEMAHAWGYTKEMDAELLTWLSLRLSCDERLNSLAPLMILNKSGLKFKVSKELSTEMIKKYEEKVEVQKEQKFVNFLRDLFHRGGIQINEKQYGYTQPDKNKIPQGVFFDTALRLEYLVRHFPLEEQ